MQNAVCQQLRRRLTGLVPEVKDHDSLRGFLPGVPRREGPQPARNEARLGHSQEESGGDERAIAFLKGLEDADRSEQKELERQPFSWADPVEDHVRGNLEQHDAQGQHLLADVELVLVDADIFHELVGDGVGDVPSVQFCDRMALARAVQQSREEGLGN